MASFKGGTQCSSTSRSTLVKEAAPKSAPAFFRAQSREAGSRDRWTAAYVAWGWLVVRSCDSLFLSAFTAAMTGPGRRGERLFGKWKTTNWCKQCMHAVSPFALNDWNVRHIRVYGWLCAVFIMNIGAAAAEKHVTPPHPNQLRSLVWVPGTLIKSLIKSLLLIQVCTQVRISMFSVFSKADCGLLLHNFTFPLSSQYHNPQSFLNWSCSVLQTWTQVPNKQCS